MSHEFETSRAALKFLLNAVLGMLCVVLLACGGSRSSVQTEGRPSEEVDIDKLLGGDEQQQQTPQQNSEEDEVLRLLGLVPDSKAEAPKTETVVAETPKLEPEPKPEVKPEEMDRLERELQQKNQFITELQSNLGEKEKRIQTLQTELEQAKRNAMASGSANNSKMISGNYAQRYAAGRELYEQRRYREAINVFSVLLREDDKNKLADNAQYWIGEAYYGMRNFSQAMIEFEKISLFSSSEKSDDAQLKIALCYLQQNDRQQAKSELEQLLATYPTSEYIEKAKQYLSKL